MSSLPQTIRPAPPDIGHVTFEIECCGRAIEFRVYPPGTEAPADAWKARPPEWSVSMHQIGWTDSQLATWREAADRKMYDLLPDGSPDWSSLRKYHREYEEGGRTC